MVDSANVSADYITVNTANTELWDEGFHKSQHFQYINGIPCAKLLEPKDVLEKPAIGRQEKEKLFVYEKITPPSSDLKGQGGFVPSWILFDKKILCFDAFFQEDVSNSITEQKRIRMFKIYFYLKDGTIQVVEPKCKNSGIHQGTFIHRQRIPLPPPNNDQFYNIFHFNLNQQMVFYSRTFTVTNCDTFTRNYLTNIGVILNDPPVVPDDPYVKWRQQIEKINPLRPYERHDTLKQFLDHDHEVLRFNCYWDETESGVTQDFREFILYYFLGDDTIKIQELFPPNCGRHYLPTFLRRSKLPKHITGHMKLPGWVTNRTVLNLSACPPDGQHYVLLDSLKTGAIHEEFYKDCDLRVGGNINVWGRKMIITDCDNFTKTYYQLKYGRECTPVKYKVPPAPKPLRVVPPYNGFGSEEDSLGSCHYQGLRQPRKNFLKFMDKDGCEVGSVLAFLAKMVTADPLNAEREFIISFYLADDSISVTERPQKKSGLLCSKFLRRGRVKKPGQELFKSTPSEYFTAQDLCVGATLCLYSHKFQLLEADEFTLKYMEKCAKEFPQANVDNILSKLTLEKKQSEIKQFLAVTDPNNTGVISCDSFRDLLMRLDCGLTEHEVLTLARTLVEHKEPEVDVGLMLAVTQDILKRKYFDHFPDLARAFEHQDQSKSGRLSTKEIWTTCKSFRLPLSEKLLGALLSVFADGDEIDYKAFLSGINWLEHPAPPVMSEDVVKFEAILRSDASRRTVEKNILYSSLLVDPASPPVVVDPTAAD